MKLVVAIPVQHAVDFEDVAVRIRPREFVASTIKAKNELLGHMYPTGCDWTAVFVHFCVARGWARELRRKDRNVQIFCTVRAVADTFVLGIRGVSRTDWTAAKSVGNIHRTYSEGKTGLHEAGQAHCAIVSVARRVVSPCSCLPMSSKAPRGHVHVKHAPMLTDFWLTCKKLMIVGPTNDKCGTGCLPSTTWRTGRSRKTYGMDSLYWYCHVDTRGIPCRYKIALASLPCGGVRIY